MSKRKIVRGATCLGAVAVGVLMTTSSPSAVAAPPPVSDAAGLVSIDTALAAPAPTSWRGTTADAAVLTHVAQRPVTQRVSRTAAPRAVTLARYSAFTMQSKETRDMRGVEKSLYRGRYYRAATETKRLCIVRRESEGHYDVVSRSRLYYGAYQVSRELARGATWMMLKEHKALMGEAGAKTVLAKLRKTPMNRWPRYWQDAAWATVANWEGTGSGLRHWAGGRWHC